ncbi:MAG: cytidylate kinase [Verrucomicrobia bacterium]|nr:MAG: cytidylate kinase [Verrucomicrobiota bacterium]
MSTPFIIVAIDGGAAAGKSTTARALSARFNLLHIDTGSYYRAITAELLRLAVDPSDLAAVGSASTTLHLGTRIDGRRAQIEIAGRLIADAELRGPAVNATVSHFAAIPALRAALLAYQRDQARIAREHRFAGLVMEGRDIGTVIFPQADFRFFLHADPEERARRRAAEGQQDSIAERDRLDSTRKASPLTCPIGATDIDSTHLGLDEVVERVAAPIATRLGLPA